MESLEEITIEHIVNNLFPSRDTKRKKKEIIEFYLQQFGIDLFGNVENSTSISSDDIQKRVEYVLKSDKRTEKPFLSQTKSYYRKTRGTGTIIEPLPYPIPDGSPLPLRTAPDSNYIGKGGECVVMGELLFRGYNVNNMMVDEGIDLVASKDNAFYYIQVKTKNIEESNKFYFQIKYERFGAFLGTQMRYILVARCSIKKTDRNVFFRFSNDDIQKFMFDKVIPQPQNDNSILSIKIEFDSRTGQAFMYDGNKRSDVTYFMNNFNL